MTAPRSVALLAVVLVLGLTVSPVASGAFVGAIGADDPAEPDDPSEPSDPVEQSNVEDESSPSDAIESEQSVATYMQSSAADTSNTVESSMFEEKYESADNDSQEGLVDDRADTLSSELEALENERDELHERQDELSTPQYQARMTRLTVEIAALERSVEQTKPFASDTNVGLDRLASVQERVAELGGQQIAEFAKGLIGFDQYLDDGPFSDQLPGGDEEPVDESEEVPGDDVSEETPGESDAVPPDSGETDSDTGNESVNETDNATGDNEETPVVEGEAETS
jgi:hypothetical protein